MEKEEQPETPKLSMGGVVFDYNSQANQFEYAGGLLCICVKSVGEDESPEFVLLQDGEELSSEVSLSRLPVRSALRSLAQTLDEREQELLDKLGKVREQKEYLDDHSS